MILLTACVPGQTTIKAGDLTIAAITTNPAQYEGKTVTLNGEYWGWEGGYGSPPVTRSDWLLKDATGAIYVTGWAPAVFDPVNDRGKNISVSGVVKVKNGTAYIDAQLPTSLK
ncbi:MAG: hypothetical protein ABIH70_03590 [Chloroflexota bacterium]